MTITNKDITKLKEVFLTKEEAKVFATKDDLKNLRGEFKSDIWGVKNDIENSRNELRDEMREKFNEVITGQDKLMSRFETAIQEVTVTYAQYRRQDEQLENHEKRITHLESTVPS